MSQLDEARIQLTDERKKLSEITLLLKSGISLEVSKRPETTLAQRAVEMSFMWLGKAKGAVGSSNPYPESTNVTNKVIEPAQDVVDKFSAEVQSVLNSISKEKGNAEREIVFIKLGRNLLNGITKAIENDMSILTDRQIYQLCVANAWTYAEEAKMRLGQVLGIIREENEGKFPTSQDLKVEGKPEKAPKPPKAPKQEKAKKEGSTEKTAKDGQGKNSAQDKAK